MKKLMIATAAAILLSGCGNSWEVTKKTLNSDFGDISRHVVAYDSFTKETLWEYTGDVYMTDSSGPGNVTIIYRDSIGKVRKNDFIGTHVQVVMLEVSHDNRNIKIRKGN